MCRLACVDVPAFPLQLLLRDHPDWRGLPVAVVAEDRPQSLLLWVNEKARRGRVLPGQRYAQALSLAADLRAGTVSTQKIAKGNDLLCERLRRTTPDVEPASGAPGVFWLNAGGLGRLYSGLEHWARTVRGELSRERFDSTVVVGFTRFGTYAVAKTVRGTRVFKSSHEERIEARRVRLDRLEIAPRVREALEKLGILTVGDFLRLPAGGLLERFGPDAHRLHRLASGDLWAPIRPRHPVEPLEGQIFLDVPESDVERLLFLVKRILNGLLEDLASSGEALTALTLHLSLDGRGRDGRAKCHERIRTAAPTIDSAQILGLVRLRLESLRLQSGVVELKVAVSGTMRIPEQYLLFARKPRRDLEAASRAFARLRAELGDGAVLRARLLEGHLPRAHFEWEPMEKALEPEPDHDSSRPLCLVRRVYEKPLLLPHRARHEPDGWLLRGLEHGPVRSFVGPYLVSGGWWAGGIHREYYFVKMHNGEVLWIFYDRRRRSWFLEGRVE